MNEFIDKLRDRVPTYDEFELYFSEIGFTDTATKQKSLVQYMLRKFDMAQNKYLAKDYSKMSIEHLAAQNAPREPFVAEYNIAQLAPAR